MDETVAGDHVVQGSTQGGQVEGHNKDEQEGDENTGRADAGQRREVSQDSVEANYETDQREQDGSSQIALGNQEWPGVAEGHFSVENHTSVLPIYLPFLNPAQIQIALRTIVNRIAREIRRDLHVKLGMTVALVAPQEISAACNVETQALPCPQ